MARLFIWFMLYSFIGWSYETTLYSVKNKSFVHSGMMYGCYCPIYGLGALMGIYFLSGVKSVALLFFGSVIVCGALEYAASWLIERIFGARWWDYSDWPFNINGRVCLFGGIAFGAMSLLLIKRLHPAVEAITAMFPDQLIRLAAAVLFVIFAVDLLATANRCRNMERKNGEINVVLKLPFDFMPKMPRFGSRVRSITACVRQNGSSLMEFVREKVEEFLGEL